MKKEKAYIYLRLSRDDGDVGESNSIRNQRELIKSYAERFNFTIAREFVDDGYSGSNFDRPDFQRMIKALEKKDCKTVIVKDLSRFGRDYIECGKYLQKVFPKLGIRFISVNDNYDSANSDMSDTHLILPIKNFINDSYCRDISIKVKSSQKIKRSKGEFIAPFAPYGYKKDPENKNHLIVDRNVSHVIKKIFEMKIEGYSSKAIADELNRLGISTPQSYKESQGSNYATGFIISKRKWQAKMINRIIENRVYIGNLEQGKRAKINYKTDKIINVMEEDWIKVENTHEAIISNSMFNIANKMMSRDIMNNRGEVRILAGLLYCADCGSQLIRRKVKTKDGEIITYNCGSYNKGQGCSKHSIKEKDILSAVKMILEKHLNYKEELFRKLREADLNKREYGLYIDDLLEEKQKYETLRRSLFIDLEDKIIDEEEFQLFRKNYQNKITEIEFQIKQRRNTYNELKNVLACKEEWLKGNEKTEKSEIFDRHTLVFYIDKILVGEKDSNGRPQLTVIFNDMDKMDILNKLFERVKEDSGQNEIFDSRDFKLSKNKGDVAVG